MQIGQITDYDYTMLYIHERARFVPNRRVWPLQSAHGQINILLPHTLKMNFAQILLPLRPQTD